MKETRKTYHARRKGETKEFDLQIKRWRQSRKAQGACAPKEKPKAIKIKNLFSDE
jgi:hypothetical protein